MLKVLLVDDEPFIVKGLSLLIDWKAEGYQIAGTASNGQEALEFLKKKKVDLIIADIKMPVMSGLELLETIRGEQLSDAYFIILSGYSDFSYAQQAIRNKCLEYVLKPIKEEELIQVIRKAARLLRRDQEQKDNGKKMEKAYLSRNVIALVSGKFDQINLDYVQQHLNLEGGVRYIDIEIDVTKFTKEPSGEKKRILQREVYARCKEYLGDNSKYCIFDVSNQEKGYDIGMIYSRHLAEGTGEQQFLDNFLLFLCKDQELPVLMFVGEQVGGAEHLCESYRTAMVVKSFRAFHAGGNITWYEQEAERASSGNVLCKQSLDGLVTAVEQNNQSEMNRTVDELYLEMNRLGTDAGLIKLNINYLLFRLIHLAVAQDEKVNQEEILRYISSTDFDKGTMRGSKRHLKEFAAEYAEYLVQIRKNASRGILGKIEREVEEHFAENLTLKKMSKKFFCNSTYLGQLFKKKYGISFKEYLNNYRMERAVQLLLRTDKKIYEIAEEVGYHDLDYFINRFIVAQGCTPSKFRKKSKEEN